VFQIQLLGYNSDLYGNVSQALASSNGLAIIALLGQVSRRYQMLRYSLTVARKSRDAAAVLFGLNFADNIHYKARLQSSKHTGAKQNLTQNGHSRSFKVTCFGVSGKAIKDYYIIKFALFVKIPTI